MARLLAMLCIALTGCSAASKSNDDAGGDNSTCTAVYSGAVNKTLDCTVSATPIPSGASFQLALEGRGNDNTDYSSWGGATSIDGTPTEGSPYSVTNVKQVELGAKSGTASYFVSWFGDSSIPARGTFTLTLNSVTALNSGGWTIHGTWNGTLVNTDPMATDTVAMQVTF